MPRQRPKRLAPVKAGRPALGKGARRLSVFLTPHQVGVVERERDREKTRTGERPPFAETVRRIIEMWAGRLRG